MNDTIATHLSPVWGRITNIAVDRGEGACLYSTDGRRYLDFTRDGQPDTTTAKAVTRAAAEGAGLLLLTCGTYDNVIRWILPLVVTEEQIDEALGIFAGALDKII